MSAARNRAGLGIAYAVAGVLGMTVMDTIVKWLSTGYPVSEIVFFRNAFGLIPLLIALPYSGGVASLRSRRPGLQLLRGLFALGAAFTFFAALRDIPLAEALALAFAGPLFITALSVPLLREQVGLHRWSAVVVGFVGTLVILRPGAAAFQPEAVLVIAAAFCYAMVMIITRKLSQSDSTLSMVIWTSVFCIAATLPLLPFNWVTPTPEDLLLFFIAGAVGSGAMFLVAQSYRYASVAVVAPFDYTMLLWGTLFGWLLWRELPDIYVGLGAVIVVASGLYIIRRETRLQDSA